MNNLVICIPDTRRTRHVKWCPTCKARRRMVASHYVWYETITTCCTCGETWADGEMMERPFKPRWRKDNADKARRDYAEAVPWSEMVAWLMAEIEAKP